MNVRTRLGVLVGAAVVAATIAAAAVGIGGSDPEGAGPAGDLPPATAKVITTDLTQTEHVQGTLSYGTPKGLVNRAHGTLTWMAPAGSTVGLGQPVYAVDGHPIVLIHGTTPLYRTLHAGIQGPDVAEFEGSLAALGYSGFSVDDAYTWSTAAAVMQWQHDLGVEVTGTAEVDDVVVAPGDIRVALHGIEIGAELGTEVNQTVLTYSGTIRVVTVALDVAKQHLVHEGDPTTLTLPDGTEVAGMVSTVSTVATSPEPSGTSDGGSASAGGPAPATVTVEIHLEDQAELGTLDAAPVDVAVVSDHKEGVLAVPVAALVALTEGGHGVQVVDGGDLTYVPVETGMFADGRVEVSGAGIAEGTVVGVPA